MATAKKTARKTVKKAARKAAKPAKKAAPRARRAAKSAKPKGPPERVGVLEIAGHPATIIGNDVVVGQTAPEFTAQANNWSVFQGLASTVGKVRVLAAVPSLSTSVCDKETRTFNERASELGEDIRVMVISADLPATQKLWCGNAGVDRVQTVSDHQDMDFGVKYGTYIKERRYHRRAVFVVDRNGKVAYVAYMPHLGMEPNYDEVLAAAKAAL
ncbi:MAG: thiol peroxidase [Chloroflexi bacterium]|nr:thiol peroxidase [Chloroflexota bacterium]